MAESELRIRLNEWMTDALYHLSQRIGMNYTNITRMALMEYMEKRLQPSDYESIEYFQHNAVRNAIFEFEHYKRIIQKYSEKKANLFKQLFIVALQNYKELKHTFFDKYKTDISRFKEVIWKEPGVIDLLHFVTHLNNIPLPDKDQYEHLLKNGKKIEYYNKKWDEIYNNLKDMIGRKKHENYAKICEMKVDHHIHTDTDMMYFLLEKLKNNEALPPDSGHETKNLVDCSTSDEGLLEEMIKEYGIDFSFVDEEELDEIGKKYGILAQINYMIKYSQDGVKAYKDGDKNRYEFEKKQLEDWKNFKKEFMEKTKKKGEKKKHDKKKK